jgi:ferredoxin
MNRRLEEIVSSPFPAPRNPLENEAHAPPRPAGLLEREDLPRLFDALKRAGYRIVGPTVRDGAIVYGEVGAVDDLPVGWTERQEAGRYRLERRPDAAVFGFNLGPQSWKKYLFPPRTRLWTAETRDGSFQVTREPPDEGAPYAFLGMRACELSALSITDRVFTGGVVDPVYQGRRARILRIAVECGQSAPTCFCTSMGTGPGADGGFDLSLTELLSPGRHVFWVRTASEAGERLASELPLRPGGPDDLRSREELLDRAAREQRRKLPADRVRGLLLDHLEDPHWEEVAQRCLSCGNCTMVCPTCFCSTTEEVPSLDLARVEHWRRWDSCFNLAFSQLHTVSIRTGIKSRYRQWIDHKLATWHDQFGSSGCVGCGRCITWCPVGIDLTEEVAALERADPASRLPAAGGKA